MLPAPPEVQCKRDSVYSQRALGFRPFFPLCRSFAVMKPVCMDSNLCHTYTPRWALLPCRVKGQATRRMPCPPCFSRVVFFFFLSLSLQSLFKGNFSGVAGAASGPVCFWAGGSWSRRETEAAGGRRQGASHLSVPWRRPRGQLRPRRSPGRAGGRRRGFLSRPGPGRERGGARAAPLHQQLSPPPREAPRPGVQRPQAQPQPRSLVQLGPVTGGDTVRPASRCSRLVAHLPPPGAASRRETTAITIRGSYPPGSARLSPRGPGGPLTPCATRVRGVSRSPSLRPRATPPGGAARVLGCFNGEAPPARGSPPEAGAAAASSGIKEKTQLCPRPARSTRRRPVLSFAAANDNMTSSTTRKLFLCN